MGPGGRAVVAASAIKVFVTRPARRLYNNLDAPIKPLILAAVKSLKADTAPQGSKGLTAAYSGFMSLKVTSPGGDATSSSAASATICAVRHSFGPPM